jgi:hypothetical protein
MWGSDRCAKGGKTPASTPSDAARARITISSIARCGLLLRNVLLSGTLKWHPTKNIDYICEKAETT